MKGLEQRIVTLEKESVMKVPLTEEEKVNERRNDITDREERQGVINSQMSPDMEAAEPGTPLLLPQVLNL